MLELNEAIARRLKQLMHEKNFSQYALFKECGVPCATISTILSCKEKSVTSQTLLNLCRGLNVRLGDFFNSELFEFENLSDDSPVPIFDEKDMESEENFYREEESRSVAKRQV